MELHNLNEVMGGKTKSTARCAGPWAIFWHGLPTETGAGAASTCHRAPCPCRPPQIEFGRNNGGIYAEYKRTVHSVKAPIDALKPQLRQLAGGCSQAYFSVQPRACCPQPRCALKQLHGIGCIFAQPFHRYSPQLL